MASNGFKRKLSAILSADVVGYSRLMQDDEEATVRTLKVYKEMTFELIERNKGRLVDSTGDNMLVESESILQYWIVDCNRLDWIDKRAKISIF